MTDRLIANIIKQATNNSQEKTMKEYAEDGKDMKDYLKACQYVYYGFDTEKADKMTPSEIVKYLESRVSAQQKGEPKFNKVWVNSRFPEAIKLMNKWIAENLGQDKQATKKVAVSESELLERAEEYAKRLENEHGYPKIDVDPYFAYGKYGFYFEFKDENGQLKQAKVDLGTKKECLEGLKKLFYRLADNPDWWLRRGKQASKDTVAVRKQARAKYTQRQLKEMVADGTAIDITTWPDTKIYELIREEQLDPIGSSFGVYGANGRLFRGKSGKLYACTARNSNLDRLPW